MPTSSEVNNFISKFKANPSTGGTFSSGSKGNVNNNIQPRASLQENLPAPYQGTDQAGFINYLSQQGVIQPNQVGEANRVVNAANLGTPAITMPKPEASVFTPIVPVTTNPAVNPTTENPQTSAMNTFQSYLSETANAMNDVPSAVDTEAQLRKDLRLQQKEQAVNDLTATQNTILAQGQADIMAARNQSSMEGGTAGILSAREDAINRSVAIKVLPVQAQLAAAQGNLTLAQNRLDTMLSLRMKDAEMKYTNRIKLLDAIYGFATEQQKAEIDAQKLEKEMAWEREKLDIMQEHDIQLKNIGLSGTGDEAPKVVDINGVSSIWNPSTGKYEPVNIGVGTTSDAENQSLATVNKIDSILNSNAFDSTFGMVNALQRNIPGTDAYVLSSEVNNLISNLSLAARGKLKGQGQISDFEGKMLRDAQTALKINMTPEQAKQQLLNVKGAIRTSSGLSTTVKIVSPDGSSKIGTANQQIINDAIKEGYTVIYQ